MSSIYTRLKEYRRISMLFDMKELQEAALIFETITIPLLCEKYGYSAQGLEVSKDGRRYTDKNRHESGDVVDFIKRKTTWMVDHEAIEEVVEIAYKEGYLRHLFG